MMMKMVEAGGVPLLTDGVRPADEDNPYGYFEFEPVKRTRRDSSWLQECRGRAVKMVHVLLCDLPSGYRYRLIMMHRNIEEVLISQDKMLERAGMSASQPSADVLKRGFAAQMASVDACLHGRPEFTRLDVDFGIVVQRPHEQAARVAAFLGAPDAVQRMAAVVDERLYRNRHYAVGNADAH